MIKLGIGEGQFQWSSSEQIWPFEKALDGSVMYCKQVDFGFLPNAGQKNVAHGIVSLDDSKVHLITGVADGADESFTLGRAYPNGSWSIDLWITPTEVKIYTGTRNYSTTACHAIRVIYWR